MSKCNEFVTSPEGERLTRGCDKTEHSRKEAEQAWNALMLAMTVLSTRCSTRPPKLVFFQQLTKGKEDSDSLRGIHTR